jgi:DNA-binding transcriptional ArsR family regulator
MRVATSKTIAARKLAKQAGQAAKLLRVMSNGHRLRVLCLLLGGEMSVGQINGMIEVSQSVLSQHLAVLRTHGLVRTRRESQTIYYSVTPGPATGVIAVLYEAYCAKPAGTARSAAVHALRPTDQRRVGASRPTLAGLS